MREVAIPQPPGEQISRSLELVPPLPEAPRTLGRLALDQSAPVLLRVLNERAAEIDTDAPGVTAELIHDTIIRPFQKRNVQGGVNPNAGLIDPNMVHKNLARYFNVFYRWPPRIAPEHLEAERVRLRDENLRFALDSIDYLDTHRIREIRTLVGLMQNFRDQQLPEAYLAAQDVLAAYGWALRPDTQARWKQLQRDTDNVHYDLG